MFNRKTLKTAALQDLKGKWGAAILVCLVSTVILGITQIPSSFVAEEGSLLLILSSALYIAVLGIIEIATVHFFLQLASSKDSTNFSTFLNGMNLWLKGILGILWSFLWIFLWSMLFLVPGIVKAYSYSQLLYILAEHPTMSVRKAMKLSKVMTRGYKGDLFVLHLSFIGWSLLCLLTIGIGFLFLVPYQMSAFTQAYRFLKAQALTSGALTETDFSDNF